MEKYVRYCPICDKYYSRWDLLCDFCLRDNIPLDQWESMTKKEKEAWKTKTKPRRNIDELDPDFRKEIQDKANGFDTEYRASLAKEAERAKYVPECPTCGSPDLSKIGAGSKMLDVAFWGFVSGKARKTFHCNNCGYEW